MKLKHKKQMIKHVENLYVLSAYAGQSFCEAGMLATVRANHVTFGWRANKCGAQVIYELIVGKVWRLWHDGKWHEVRDGAELKKQADDKFEAKIDALKQEVSRG